MRCAPSPKRRYVQLYLDLGQTNFTHTTCSVCGLLYAMGVQQDDKVHASFHKAFVEGITFKGWKKERAFRVKGRKDQRIVLILPTDSEVHQRKVREVAEVMEADLGLAEEWLLSKPCKVYLYIAASKVVGCLMVESISQAYRTVLLPPPSSPLREAEQREPLLEVAPAADVSKGDAFVSMGRVFPGRGATLGGAQGVLGSVREGSVSGFDGGRFVETGGVQNGLEREEGVCAFVNNGTAAKEGEGTARGLGSAADEGLREEGTEPLEERAAEGSVGERTRESSAGVPETGSPRRSGVNALFDVTNREVPGSIRSGECAGAGTGRTLRSRTALAKGKIEERTNRGEEGAAREGALIRRNEQLVAFGQPTGTGGTVQHAVESNPIDSFSVGGEHLEFGADGCGRQPGPETKSQERQDTGPSCGQPTVVPSVAVTQQEFPYVDAIQPSHQSPSETPQPSEPLGQRERLQTPSGTPPPLSFGQLDRSQEASEGPKALQGRPSLYAQMMSASGRKRVKSEKRTAETEKLTSAGEPQALMCRTEAVRATCGVRAIWVRKAERRKGVASALMDAMRSSFVTGCVLEPAACAFSQPTPDGRRFAARYCNTNTFLVYQ